MFKVHGSRLRLKGSTWTYIIKLFFSDLFLIIDKYMVQGTLLKMLSCHYRKFQKYFLIFF